MEDPQVQAVFTPELGLNTTVQLDSTSLDTYHLVSGSFRSLSLFLLAFSPRNRSISHVQTVPAFGPHQYLATTPRKDKLYTTSWALPPTLSSWSIDKGGHSRNWEKWRVELINTAPITATSSYITLPPPYTDAYSVGGPTGEIHALNPTTGGFKDKKQELLFVPEHELEKADKTRVALRYGSHGIEFSAQGHAFIPHLGQNSIEIYTFDREQPGTLKYVDTMESPRLHDGPRHCVVSPDGNKLYVVTEHTNYLDIYSISPTGTLTHLQSRSLLPPHLRSASASFRGDTLRLSPSTPLHPSPPYLFATTRGGRTETRGWISVFQLNDRGYFALSDQDGESDDEGVEYWETPTSGGKANAIDLLPREEDGVWIALTDDDELVEDGGPGVRVLEWKGWGTGGFSVVTEWPSRSEAKAEGKNMRGGSHAIWLD